MLPPSKTRSHPACIDKFQLFPLLPHQKEHVGRGHRDTLLMSPRKGLENPAYPTYTVVKEKHFDLAMPFLGHGINSKH